MSDLDRTTILSLDDAAVALRTLPYGGIDDSTRQAWVMRHAFDAVLGEGEEAPPAEEE